MNFLFFQNWREIETHEDTDFYIVRAVYESTVQECRHCLDTNNFAKARVEKKFLKDAPVRGKTVIISLSIDVYECSNCNSRFTPKVPQIIENTELTKRLAVYIIKESIKKNFSQVSRETGVSESTVREIFTAFVDHNHDMLSDETPRAMGIDEVYVDRVARCILTDIEKKKVIELLPKRDLPTINNFFYHMKDRDKVEFVAMDMHRPFYSSVKEAFRNAKPVIDTFHVQSKANQAISNFLAITRAALSLHGRRLQMRDRFLLLTRYHRLSEEEKEQLNDWKSKWPELAEIHNLKEEFFTIWRLSKREDAETKYVNWKKGMSATARSAFLEIIIMIENWYDAIFNYIDCRFTNAFTESANNLIKRLQSDGRGCHYETIRPKILYRYHLDEIFEGNIILAAADKSGLTRIQRLKNARERRIPPLPE